MFVACTDEMIDAARSEKGGWSEKQLKLLGIKWPPIRGWKNAVVGKRIAGSVMASFIELKDQHLT